MMRAPVRPITFAHRGARTEAPENTMPAFRRALELGARGLETDAWVSGEGEVVLAHARRILAEAAHPLVTVVDTMDGAADKAAELANGGK